MNVDLHQPAPPEPEVHITMTAEEASILHAVIISYLSRYPSPTMRCLDNLLKAAGVER